MQHVPNRHEEVSGLGQVLTSRIVTDYFRLVGPTAGAPQSTATKIWRLTERFTLVWQGRACGRGSRSTVAAARAQMGTGPNAVSSGANRFRYRHVVVDEVQDFNPYGSALLPPEYAHEPAGLVGIALLFVSPRTLHVGFPVCHAAAATLAGWNGHRSGVDDGPTGCVVRARTNGQLVVQHHMVGMAALAIHGGEPEDVKVRLPGGRGAVIGHGHSYLQNLLIGEQDGYKV
jgi:hypothetical protein